MEEREKRVFLFKEMESLMTRVDLLPFCEGASEISVDFSPVEEGIDDSKHRGTLNDCH